MKDEGGRRFLASLCLALAGMLGAGEVAAQIPPVSAKQAAEAESSFEDYRRALSSYIRGDHASAERLFEAIARVDRKEPETIKAHYFLARSRMKLRKWKEASAGLIRIYSIDPIFYRQWNCDFLLGEARAGMGLD